MALCLGYSPCCGHEISNAVAYRTHALFQNLVNYQMCKDFSKIGVLTIVPPRHLAKFQGSIHGECNPIMHCDKLLKQGK